MSKIQEIQYGQNILPQSPKNQVTSKNYQQNFKALSPAEMDVYQKTIETLANSTNKPTKMLLKLCNKMANTAGEVQSQIINAVFTTTLAPFFIAFNPLSDQDSNTKKYTALRQPVSAAIAITGGWAMTKVINNAMDKLHFGGFIPATDGRINPEAKILKADFMKEYDKCAADKKIEFLEKYSPEIEEAAKLDKNGNPSKKYISAALNNYATKIQEKRQSMFSKLIGVDPKSPEFVKIKDEVLKADIPNFSSIEQIDKYVEKNSLFNAPKEFFKELSNELSIDKIKKELTDSKNKEILSKKTKQELEAFKDSLKVVYEGLPSTKEETLELATKHIKSLAKSDKARFGALKNYTGIITNLFTTAITCTVLNWVYPRFVEAFFPDLVKSSAKKVGGNK